MAYPRGIRNNNPLNIRKGSTWEGEKKIQTDPSFEQFETLQYGIRAGLKLIQNHVSGFNGSRPPRNTIRKLISVWAPPSENATEAYIMFVCQHVFKLPSDIIHADDKKLICDIARAMAFVECGQWIDPEQFESAYNLI